MKGALFLGILTFFLFETTFSAEYDFFKGEKTKIKNPFKLRDPFKKPVLTGQKKVLNTVPNKVGENSYSNIPNITGVALEKIKVIGVMLGKNRRAVVKVSGKDDSFIVKEGMTLGVDQAVVKAILPGGIVLVEKIKNVYDQFEYLETLLPIITE